MTLKIRRFIYISFIVSFLLIAPLLLLYTSGYRWNSYHHRLQKIGSLVIRTMPRTVTIDVADINVTKATPWRYNHLLPNEYLITITKEGYDTWQKTLTISQGQATFAEHVYLFKNQSQPEIIIPDQIDYWAYQDKNNSSLFAANQHLNLYNHRTDNQEQLLPFTETINDSDWSDDESLLLLYTDRWLVWSQNNRNNLTDINKTFLSSYNCRFRTDENNAVYCQDDTSIYEHHLITHESKTLLTTTSTERIIDFIITDKTYVLSENQDDGNVYLRINDPLSAPKPDFLLPASPDYRLLTANQNHATILDEINDILYLLNLSDQEESFNKSSRIIKDVKKMSYNERGDLLYYNDWEVWIYKNDETELITRQSNPIIEAFWYPSDNHIGVVSTNSLKIIELDRRDQQNSTVVSEWQGIKKAYLDGEAEHIIFLSKENNLFKLSILDKDVGFERPNWTP